MSAQPGLLQVAFTAGALSPTLHERDELKYFQTGVDEMVNAETIPQGGFTITGGFEHLANINSADERLIPFTANTGSVFMMAWRAGNFSVYQGASAVATGSMPALTLAMMDAFTYAQKGDTLLLFHEDLPTKRVTHFAANDWRVDDAPFENVFNYDYGGPIGGGEYTNGVAAVHELEFENLNTGSPLFTLTISNETTRSIQYQSNFTNLSAVIKAEIENLPNVASGIVVEPATSSSEISITFSVLAMKVMAGPFPVRSSTNPMLQF